LTKALYEPQPKGEQVIADFLGVALHELWPARWTIDGRRIRPRYAHKYITAA
jgi:Ner family transcriptional regulator